MHGVIGIGQHCVIAGIGRHNGLSDDRSLDMNGLKNLVIVDLDYFPAHEDEIRQSVQAEIAKRDTSESYCRRLAEERDLLHGKLEALKAMAHRRREFDETIVPLDIFAITGE